MSLKIKFKKLSDKAITPTRSYGVGNCWDVYALENTTIHSYESTIVKTGLSFEVPEGYQMHIYNRSGNPIKKGLILSNSVGILDTDYRGELGVMFHSLPKQKDLVHNASLPAGLTYPNYVLCDNIVEISAGDKIAQIKLVRIEDEELDEVAELSETTRGEGGFGSTGNKQ